MKLNFKSILIIFLVAFLGAGVACYGVLTFYNKENKNNDDTQLVINEVSYSDVEKSSYTTAIEKAYNTVVEIKANVQTSSYYYFGGTTTGTSTGSGVIISQDGYIVTNEHVISGALEGDSIKVTLYNDETYTATLIGSDEKTDLALLKIEATDLPYSTFADSSQLVLGQDAIVIGNPLGLGISCSNGIVSALEKEIYVNNVYLTVIQTNAAINAGNSGGGLFDINGNLIGIVNAKKSTSASTTSTIEGMGYAIPSNTVVTIIEQLKENGYVKNRPALGIKVATTNYTNVNGIQITDVTDGGNAQEAGLQVNDIITAIDDVQVTSYATLAKVLDSKTVGQTVKVTVLRNNETLNINVTLQESASY